MVTRKTGRSGAEERKQNRVHDNKNEQQRSCRQRPGWWIPEEGRDYDNKDLA
jgi:hypothetical protein